MVISKTIISHIIAYFNAISIVVAEGFRTRKLGNSVVGESIAEHVSSITNTIVVVVLKFCNYSIIYIFT